MENENKNFNELVNPINLRRLMETSQTFRFDTEIDMNASEADMFDDEEFESHEAPDSEWKPWEKTFDVLKSMMDKVTIGKHVQKDGTTEMVYLHKRTTKQGSGEPMGRKRNRVHYIYQMFYDGECQPFLSSYHRKNSAVVKEEYDDVMPGVWLSLETMRKGEEAEFIVDHKLMFGKLGTPIGLNLDQKKNADVLLILNMVDFVEIGKDAGAVHDNSTEEAAKSFNQVKQNVIDYKNRAIDSFRRKRYENSILNNQRAFQLLQFCELDDKKADKDEHHELIIGVLMQLLDCYMETERWKKARSIIDNLTELKFNVKNDINILVKRAKILTMMNGDYDQSITILRGAQSIDPYDMSVSSALDETIAARNKYKADSKSLWQRAFQSKGSANKPKEESVEDATFKKTMTEIVKSIGKLAIGADIPLDSSFTRAQLKLVEQIVDENSNLKLYHYDKENGDIVYAIKKFS